jgi:hypothetical protein
MRGQKVCDSHGGKAKAARAKAAERLAEAEAAKQVAKFGWDPIGNPYEVLSDLLGEIVAFKDYLRGKVDELDRLVTFGEAGEQVKGVLGAYERALDRSLKAAGEIGKLDLSARALAFDGALAQAQAERLELVINETLTAMEFAPEVGAEFWRRLVAGLGSARREIDG